MAKQRKDWIAEATKNRGGLRRLAERSRGAMTERGTIRVAWLRKMAKRDDKVGRQARLALTLRRLRRG